MRGYSDGPVYLPILIFVNWMNWMNANLDPVLHVKLNSCDESEYWAVTASS